MHSEVSVKFANNQDFRFDLEHHPLMPNDVARRWLDDQFVAMESEPLRASGKLLLADKVVVVAENTPFAACRSIEELDKKFPGVTTILQTWFTSYKGRDKEGKLLLSSPGFKGRSDAINFIGDAVLDYEKSVTTDADRRPLDEKGNPKLYRWPLAKNMGE